MAWANVSVVNELIVTVNPDPAPPEVAADVVVE